MQVVRVRRNNLGRGGSINKDTQREHRKNKLHFGITSDYMVVAT